MEFSLLEDMLAAVEELQEAMGAADGAKDLLPAPDLAEAVADGASALSV